jgi:hypothetical protein
MTRSEQTLCQPGLAYNSQTSEMQGYRRVSERNRVLLRQLCSGGLQRLCCRARYQMSPSACQASSPSTACCCIVRWLSDPEPAPLPALHQMSQKLPSDPPSDTPLLDTHPPKSYPPRRPTRLSPLPTGVRPPYRGQGEVQGLEWLWGCGGASGA